MAKARARAAGAWEDFGPREYDHGGGAFVLSGLALGGLLVSRAIFARGWTVSHVASGRKLPLGPYRTAGDARAAVERLLAAGDWTRDSKTTERARTLRAAMKAEIGRARR